MAKLEVMGNILKCIHDGGSFEEIVISHIIKFYGTNKCCLEIKTTGQSSGVKIKFSDQQSLDNALTQLRGIF